VLISDRLWRRRFNASRAIEGRTISVNGAPHEVVGVLPPDFRFPRVSRLYSIDSRASAGCTRFRLTPTSPSCGSRLHWLPAILSSD
jgi:hypothetical protein